MMRVCRLLTIVAFAVCGYNSAWAEEKLYCATDKSLVLIDMPGGKALKAPLPAGVAVRKVLAIHSTTLAQFRIG